MGAKKDKVRILAECYYTENPEVTQLDVADKFQVTQKTVSLWVNTYGWNEKREILATSPTRIKQRLLQEVEKLLKGEKSDVNADAVNKFMAAIERCEQKYSVAVVIELLTDLDNFICQSDPAFAAKCIEYHRAFIMYRIDQE